MNTMSNHRFWSRVVALWPAREALAWWDFYLEGQADRIRPFLRPCTGVRSACIPCPGSGIRLTVRERDCGGFVAFPTGDDCEAEDDLFLEWADVQAWQLDPSLMLNGIRESLGVEPVGSEPWAEGCGQDEMVEVGSCRRNGGKRVLLCLATEGQQAIAAICETGLPDGVGCVLMAERFAGVRALLRMKGATELLMGECLRIEDGRLCGDCGGACMAVGDGGMRDLSVREAVAHFDGRLEKVGREVVGEIGGRIDRVGNDMAGRIERVEQVRRTDVGQIRQQRETIGDMAQGVDKFLAGLQGRLNKAEQRLFFELIEKIDDGGLHRPLTYSEIGKRLGGVSKQAVGNKVRNLFKRHPAVMDYVLETRRPEKPINFSEMSPSARRKTGIDSSYDHSVS